ncbi:MAG: UvrD-helicase domain-containing protein [Chloroflexi bacterium]|nr:UvrD-helicase domain-containing protein [Chloroflexota bacterium]
MAPRARLTLTAAQQRIVDWDEGPLVVIAGAGTGKTRVIVARVAHLLRTHGTQPGGLPAEPAPDHDPFAGPLVPEQVLVLTYNVRAARQLADRIQEAIGAAARARLPVSNFHSFCHRILSDNAAEAGLAANPDVLDGIGQVLLLRDIRPDLPLIYHSGKSNPNYWLDQFVGFINRAKDELVTPDAFDAFVAAEHRAFEARYGSIVDAFARVEAQGILRGPAEVKGFYAGLRANERAAARGDATANPDPTKMENRAEREARRAVIGTGNLLHRNRLTADQLDGIDELAATYESDGAALEVMRLGELGLVYRAYQAELERRGALDFGEQIAAVTRLFKRRPNVLRRYQRQYRYILVDEFQDANIAQIELVEMLARTPDRPANLMVVGDDDQSIYRFRGASFAAFAELNRRFGPADLPTRMRLEENFRSTAEVLTVANRLIRGNQTRFLPDKELVAMRGPGAPVELITCASSEDEAAAIVDSIKAEMATGAGEGEGRPPSAFAVLYRKHKHREAIVARLRDEGIPYTVAGGLSLFAAPEIRDLEQGLRTIADPQQDVALVRMMTAGPWRLDAIEILHLARTARYDRTHIVDVIRGVVASGELDVDRVDGTAATTEVVPPAPDRGGDEPPGAGLALQPKPEEIGAAAPHRTRNSQRVVVAPLTRTKLRRLLGTLDELTPMTWRDGPLTILERFVERTGLILDLVAVDTLESKRMVGNIASFLRFAADWQKEHPNGTLAGFVEYLDAYQSAGGDLPTSVELTDDVDGVRLMTLYQAKGLEFPIVFVPQLLQGEWPAREFGSGLFPKDLLREAIPAGDIHTEEERRLLYVALTRAQDRLVVTTHGAPAATKDPSVFVDELLDGAGEEITAVDRTGATEGGDGAPPAAPDPLAALRRTMPVPSAQEPRLTLRLRAVELLSLIEGTSEADPEGPDARVAVAAELGEVVAAVALDADSARARGLDPLSLRAVTLDTDAGANLLDVLPLPSSFSYSQFSQYERCPAQYAFNHVYRIPSSRTVAAFSFGSSAHAAFENFTKERRERAVRGDPPPTREDLERLFQAEWPAGQFGDQVTEEGYARRVGTLLDNFWQGELAGIGTAEHEELDFDLTIEPDDGSPPFTIHGQIDRVDRLPTGGIEIVDYKTGRIESQTGVDKSLQLSIYALAARDALGLGTPEAATLYFTEAAVRRSTTRTDEQLDAARDDLVARAERIRSGDFAATPGKPCYFCDYAAMCPSRAR